MSSQVAENLTVVLPAKNEAVNLEKHLREIKALYPLATLILVDDGSNDGTGEIAKRSGAEVVTHPYSLGNGAAIKSGARKVKTKYTIFMDADGQHRPTDIAALIDEFKPGIKMCIGARIAKSHATIPRRMMNLVYNRIASAMTGFKILDLTSGFRLVETKAFLQFLYLLPNGFSYPTTITMAFLRSGLPIRYVEIEARQREGKSKIRPLKDGLKFLIIILKIGALFSPMRLFLPISATFFATGLLYYAYTFFVSNRFTNMGILLFLSAILIFLIGIISEQISSLHYQKADLREQDLD